MLPCAALESVVIYCYSSVHCFRQVVRSDDEDDPKRESRGSKPAPSKFFLVNSDDEDDDSDWSSDSESSHTLTAKFFLKTQDYKNEADRKRKEKEQEKEKCHERAEKRKEKRRKRAEKRKEAVGNDDECTEVKGSDQRLCQPKDKLFLDDDKITNELILKKLNEILANRGKKGQSHKEMVNTLAELRSIATANNLGIATDAKLLFEIFCS